MSVRVSSGAMLPTVVLGQHVSVNDQAYRDAAPRIDDVVLCHVPRDVTSVVWQDGAACAEPRPGPSPDRMIKRVVAGPGDVISIQRGLVVRNGSTERGDHARLDDWEWSAECDLPE